MGDASTVRGRATHEMNAPSQGFLVAQKGKSKKGMTCEGLPKPPKRRERVALKRMWGKLYCSPEKTSSAAATADVSLGSEPAYRPPAGEPENPEKVSSLVGEVQTLLKTLKPVAKAVKVKRVLPLEGPTGLLDGGDTHALRRGSPKELFESDKVHVELAHGSIELKQHPLTGTILTEHAVEPIVPLRGLIELGFVIKWGAQGCEIKHPSRGTIQCWLRNGCPVVSEKHALGLIHDIESLELAKRIPMNPSENMSENVVEWWSKLFPSVPKRIWGYMNVVETESQGVHLPWNRAQRRRHAQAKAIVIHLYAGEASKDWEKDWPLGVELITLDVRDGQNVHDPATWKYIWDLAGSGRVIGVIGGPPCRTVSRMLEKRPGPPRLRSRCDDERFGFSHLSAGEASKDWERDWPPGVELLTLDVRNGQNVHDPATWKYIWDLAGSGRVIGVIGGPPCRTVSRMLEKRPGPPRLRSRCDEERFGFKHLSESQQQKTDSDTALFLKQLGLYVHAEESWDGTKWPHMEHVKNRVGFFLESPEDPKAYLMDGAGDESASFWAWEETQMFLEKYQESGMGLYSFDQGAFGHLRKKPTTCMSNLPDMSELHGCRAG